MRWMSRSGAVLVAGAMAGGDVAGVRRAPAAKTTRLGPKLKCRRNRAETGRGIRRYRTDPRRRRSPTRWTWMNRIQREGYAQAIVSKEFLQALKSLPRQDLGDISSGRPRATEIIIPWRLIDGPENADAVADEILKRRSAAHRHLDLGAINFALPLFDEDPYHTACGAYRYFRRGPQQWRPSPWRATRRWRRASSSTACRSW